jgi:predicted kinase
LLNAWLESQGDYPSLPLLPCYETCRALVRAKVSALRTRQFASGSAEAHEARAAVQRYLAWAVQRTAPAWPVLLLTCGLSGSGKTWFARQVASEFETLHLRSDVERKRLAGLTALEDSRSAPDAGLYTLEFNTRTYARLAHCAESCLRGGESVIVDAAFLRREERGAMLQLANRLQATIALVHCSAPMDVLRSRVAARREAGNDASEADVTLLDRQPSYWEPLTADERAVTIEVDTSRPQEVQAALSRLQSIVAASS